MRPLFPKNLFLFLSFSSSSSSRPFLLPISHFSTSSHLPSQLQYSTRRQDDESRNVRVSVWWDFENCHLPAGVNVFKIAQTITEAVRVNGIKGPVQITAFGDVLQLSRLNQEALSSTGINLTHIPNGGKNSADRSLLVDLMYWVSQNPPPAHVFLISGDRDFSGILHRLRMNNYNILLASTESAPNVLCSAATIMWHWNSLVKGDNLTGKHFNHPPDGPYGSWYGHYKGPLEDSFSAGEQSTSSQSEEITVPTSDINLRSIPKTVMKKIQHILSSHPKGVSITDLREELARSDVGIDKDYYGYKKFSRFLLAMPQILRLRSGTDGQFVVLGVPKKYPEPFSSNIVPSTTSVNNGKRDHGTTSKHNDREKNMARDLDGMPAMDSSQEQRVERIPKTEARDAETQSFASSQEQRVEDNPKEVQLLLSEGNFIGESVDGKISVPPSLKTQLCQPSDMMQHSSPSSSEKVADLDDVQNHSPPIEEVMSKTKVGFFTKLWRKLSGKEIHESKSESASHNVQEKSNSSGNSSPEHSFTTMENNGVSISTSEQSKAENKSKKQARHEADVDIPLSSPGDESVVDKKISGGTETYYSSKSPGFFGWIRSWWSFGESGGTSDGLAADQMKTVSHDGKPELIKSNQAVIHPGKPELTELNQTVNHSGKPELFSSSSFWSDMESFVFTPKGALLVEQSKSREDMAHNLEEDGPMVLRTLGENNLLQLVDLLIWDKKWLVENPFQTLPFRLSQPVVKSSSLGQSNGANGLRSLFVGRQSQSTLQKLSDHDVKKRHESIPHTGVSSNKSKYRSRTDILADCQKLVDEILREQPGGYNMGCFRKDFFVRYGYPLDIQKLGYQKLVSLLQNMPGVRIESANIMASDYSVNAPVQEGPILDSSDASASQTTSNSDSELSDPGKKDDGIDSPWEELGPISPIKNSDQTQSHKESKSKFRVTELKTAVCTDYEPCISDDDDSEFEGDTSCLIQPTKQGKATSNEEDSSLMQILDSWYSSKDTEDSTRKAENVNDPPNSRTDCSNVSKEPTPANQLENPTGNSRQKPRAQKYKFVDDSESGFHEKDKLIDGILHRLKKSEELKIQN